MITELGGTSGVPLQQIVYMAVLNGVRWVHAKVGRCPDDCCLCVWCRAYFGIQILGLLTLQLSVSAQAAAMDDEVFEMFGGERT